MLKLHNPNNSHLLAVIFATAIHATAAFASFWSNNIIIPSQQTIQVSFVAPSSTKQQIENNFTKKNFLDSDQKNALKKQQQKNQNYTEINSLKSSVEKKTSGQIDQNATALKSAESDPIFDAEYLNNPAPFYPASAKRQGVQGKVLLDVLVKTDGTAASVTIAHSSGSSVLDEAALEAVREWKFIPAHLGGNIIQAHVIVPIEFKIV